MHHLSHFPSGLENWVVITRQRWGGVGVFLRQSPKAVRMIGLLLYLT